jgi:hypothetical protein
MNVTRIFMRRNEVKRKKLIVLLASVALVLVLVLSGCGGGGVAEDKVYQALNPAGIFIPVDTVGLAERLDTINGKTIYLIQGEADPVIMPALNNVVNEDYPNTTWVYYNPVSSFGPGTPDDTVKAEADAVIRGIGW